VETYSAWEVLLRCVYSAVHEALGRTRREEKGGGILCRHAHSLSNLFSVLLTPHKISLNGSIRSDLRVGQCLMRVSTAARHYPTRSQAVRLPPPPSQLWVREDGDVMVQCIDKWR